MDARLKKLVGKIKGKSLREKIAILIENPSVEIAGQIYTGLPLEQSPAGLSHHHSYSGGFIEHVVATSEIALDICNVVKQIYHGKVDKDLVLAGVILHDIFKPLTYEEKDGIYVSTPLAERIDHLTLIVSELIRKGFSLDLIHIVCAHHGGDAGPVWPRTVEALVVHLADVTDSRLNSEVLRAAKYLSREATGEELQLANSKDAFEVVNSKVTEGWKGVQKTVEKIKKKRTNI